MSHTNNVPFFLSKLIHIDINLEYIKNEPGKGT